MMQHAERSLESWEAVIPGVVFPFLALWLGGGTWPARGLAAAFNLAPVAVLAGVTRLGGQRTGAVQGAATLAYGLVALAWFGATWDVAALATLGDEAGRFTPLAAAALGVVVYLAVALVSRWAGDTSPPAPEAG
jgi:hypothetical protein